MVLAFESAFTFAALAASCGVTTVAASYTEQQPRPCQPPCVVRCGVALWGRLGRALCALLKPNWCRSDGHVVGGACYLETAELRPAHDDGVGAQKVRHLLFRDVGRVVVVGARAALSLLGAREQGLIHLREGGG